MKINPWNALTIAGLGLTVAVAGAMTTAQDRDERSEQKKAELGETVPNFTLTDVNGKEHTLEEHKGKTIILEWFNPECPFVVHLYERGEFQTMPEKYVDNDDYVWISINSNAPGKQGSGLEKNKEYTEKWEMKQPLLLDEDSSVARMYGARTTPHMYIIDPDFNLVYHGAISNAPFDRVRGDSEKVNYVDQALEQLKNGETVSPNHVQPWGCSVKYADAGPQRDRRQGNDRRQRRQRDRE